MEDVLQSLFDLVVDSSTPWWLKAAIAAAGTSGVLYLRARRQRSHEYRVLLAALNRQVAEQARTIDALQAQITDLYRELREQQQAELEAQQELGKVRMELMLTHQALEEWNTMWTQAQAQISGPACDKCIVAGLMPPAIPRVTPCDTSATKLVIS